MSQFGDVISGRIRVLRLELGAAWRTDSCDDVARIECELADLERLRRENPG